MTSGTTRRHLRSLLDQLAELHLELQEIRKTPLSPETRRLFADTLEQCLQVHRLIVASVRNALRRESSPSHDASSPSRASQRDESESGNPGERPPARRHAPANRQELRA